MFNKHNDYLRVDVELDSAEGVVEMTLRITNVYGAKQSQVQEISKDVSESFEKR